MALTTRARPTSVQKKRQAGHHHQGKHYLKAYWPYLPMLVIVLMGLVINTTWTNRQHVLGASSDFSQQTLLSVTNVARVQHNEVPLQVNDQLTVAAENKAADMANRNYWSHTSPSGQTPWSFITAAGYDYALAGENLAYGFNDAAATVNGWLGSPEHRANVLNANYQDVGFGVASSPDYLDKGPATIVVAEYAEPAGATAHITFQVASTAANTPTATQLEPASNLVSRIQVITGQTSWIFYLVAALAGSALTLFVVRHMRKMKRWLNKSEKFIAHHPWLDIAMVFIVTAGYVLTRTGGVIR